MDSSYTFQGEVDWRIEEIVKTAVNYATEELGIKLPEFDLVAFGNAKLSGMWGASWGCPVGC